MAQGSRKNRSNKNLTGLKLNRKSVAKTRKMANKVSKSSRKITPAGKIKKKLQLEISNRIQQELCAKATHDGNTFKVVSLKSQKQKKKNKINNKKTNFSLGKKVGHAKK